MTTQYSGRLLWDEVVAIATKQSWNVFRFISDHMIQVIGFYEHMGARKVSIMHLDTGDFPIMEFQVKSKQSS